MKNKIIDAFLFLLMGLLATALLLLPWLMDETELLAK